MHVQAQAQAQAQTQAAPQARDKDTGKKQAGKWYVLLSNSVNFGMRDEMCRLRVQLGLGEYALEIVFFNKLLGDWGSGHLGGVINVLERGLARGRGQRHSGGHEGQ